ncbi:MAG: hypothetical protein ABSA30_07405, partial [Candidatus Aminicenantales bacterium]
MANKRYQSMPAGNSVDGGGEGSSLDRRDFIKLGGAVGAGLIMTGRSLLAAQQQTQGQTQTPPAKKTPAPRPKTNIEDALKIPKTKWSLPGPFPGRVIEVADDKAMPGGKPDAAVIKTMFEKGLRELTGKDLRASFKLFFETGDVVGLKVNPVGPGLINTRLELVDAVIDWLEANGLPRRKVIIWDRFDFMLKDAGFTADRFPGVGIEGLQTMDE